MKDFVKDLISGRGTPKQYKKIPLEPLDINWDDVQVGQYFVLEGYSVLDPEEYPKVYRDRWLREYTTALFKKQWAMNLRKYQGIELPGGVTLNAESILEEAKTEIAELRERIEKEFQLPIDFIVG